MACWVSGPTGFAGGRVQRLPDNVCLDRDQLAPSYVALVRRTAGICERNGRPLRVGLRRTTCRDFGKSRRESLRQSCLVVAGPAKHAGTHPLTCTAARLTGASRPKLQVVLLPGDQAASASTSASPLAMAASAPKAIASAATNSTSVMPKKPSTWRR